MRKALGATVEDECRLGVHKVANVRPRFSLAPSFRSILNLRLLPYSS
jgi:hypothetical protein